MAFSGWRERQYSSYCKFDVSAASADELAAACYLYTNISERHGIVLPAAPSTHALAILVRNSELLLHHLGPPLAFSLRHCTAACCILLLCFRRHPKYARRTAGFNMAVLCAKRLNCKNDFPALLSLEWVCSALVSARVAASVCRKLMELRVCPPLLHVAMFVSSLREHAELTGGPHKAGASIAGSVLVFATALTCST